MLIKHNCVTRDLYFDILKGIGIISVVVGHAFYTGNYYSDFSNYLYNFVYVYHLAIFFLVAGYFFKPEISFYDFLKKKIKSLYLSYLAFAGGFLVIDIMRGCTPQMLLDCVWRCLLLRQCSYMGAMWFVPWLLISELVFYMIWRVIKRFDFWVQILVVLLIGFVGMGLTQMHNGWISKWYVDLAMVITPILYLGYFMKSKGWISKSKYSSKSWMIMIVSAELIIIVNAITGLRVEFSQHEYYGGIGLYPMVVLGLIFCLCLGKVVRRNRCLSVIFSICGRYSFWIMALHFLIFKIIDRLYYYLYAARIEDISVVYYFPYSFPQCRPFYIILGCGIPVMMAVIFGKLKDQIFRRLCSIQEKML